MNALNALPIHTDERVRRCRPRSRGRLSERRGPGRGPSPLCAGAVARCSRERGSTL